MHHWAVKDWHRESKCVTVPRRASSNVYLARSARCATVPRRAAMNWHRQLQLEGSDKFSAWFIYRNLRYYLIIRRLKSTSFLSYVVWPAAHEWLPLYRQDIVKRPWGSQRDTTSFVKLRDFYTPNFSPKAAHHQIWHLGGTHWSFQKVKTNFVLWKFQQS